MGLILYYANALTDIPTQMLIAPVLPKMVSDRAYAVGEQFIVDNMLYKIIQAVSAADVALVVGNNCAVSDSITQQMNKDHYNNFGTSVDIASYTASNLYICPSDGYLYARAGGRWGK